MGQGVVYSESELCIARNAMLQYTEFLVRKMEQYDNILQAVMSCEMESAQIRSGLISFASRVRPLATEAYNIVSVDVNRVIGEMVAQVRGEDTFKYPETMMDQIRAILKSFLF